MLQLGGAGAAGPAPCHDTATPLSRGVCTCTATLGQLWPRDGFSLTAVPTVRRGWEHGPAPWQERGEPASVPPAARPGICSLLRQTVREGLYIAGQTLASAQSHRQEPPNRAPTTLRPWQTKLCETYGAQGLRESCRLQCTRRDSGGELEVAVPPILRAALQPPRRGEQAISDADKQPGMSSRRFWEAVRSCSQNHSPQHSPANGLHPTMLVPGHAPAGLGACTLSRAVNSPPLSTVTSGVEQKPSNRLHCTTVEGKKPAREPALPAAVSLPAPAAPRKNGRQHGLQHWNLGFRSLPRRLQPPPQQSPRSRKTHLPTHRNLRQRVEAQAAPSHPVLLLGTRKEHSVDTEDGGKQGSNLHMHERGDLQPLSHLTPLGPPWEQALGTNRGRRTCSRAGVVCKMFNGRHRHQPAPQTCGARTQCSKAAAEYKVQAERRRAGSRSQSPAALTLQAAGPMLQAAHELWPQSSTALAVRGRWG